MRVKRTSFAVVALVVCLAVAIVPAATAKKKKKPVKTFTPDVTLTVAFETPTADQYTQYTQGASHYSGKVSSGGPSACTSPRTVTISRDGVPFAQAGTNASGEYLVDLPGVPAAGSYAASVAQVVVKKTNKKTGVVTKKKCLPGTSAAVALP